jgi:hypothetical protein
VSIVSVRLSLSGAGEGIAPETRFATVEHYVDAFHESEIVHDGWALWFRSPVRIDIRHELESGLYIAEMPSIGLHACNTSIETVKGDIVDQIVLAWEEYALEDDEVLTEDARAIKYTMRNLVETATRVDETS